MENKGHEGRRSSRFSTRVQANASLGTSRHRRNILRLVGCGSSPRDSWERRITMVQLIIIVLVPMNIFANSRGHGGLLPLMGYVRSNADQYILALAGMESFIYNQHLQLDILCPAYQRDDKLKIFARQLGDAIAEYQMHEPAITPTSSRISTFRLFLTRYGKEEQDPVTSKALREELGQLTGLGPGNIIMIMVGSNATSNGVPSLNLRSNETSNNSTSSFERASAVNQLQQAACHDPTCLVARIDVDMKVKSVFFENAVQAVYDEPNGKAYFPIVWSEYYPLSAQLVELHLRQQQQQQQQQYEEEEEKEEEDIIRSSTNSTTSTTSNGNNDTAVKESDEEEPFVFQILEEHSEHRGYWREHGTGMYCLSGPHAAQFQLSEQFRGWGGEDGNYYQHVRQQLSRHRIARHNEPGLVHQWHPKTCLMGVDVMDKAQWKDCQGAKVGQMGSELGRQLLVEHMRKTLPEDFLHNSILF